MYSLYKLNKHGDNIQPWHTPFPIWNQSVFPCPVLTVAFWPAYRFVRRQVRWSGIPTSLRIFQFVVIHRVKGFGVVNKAKVDAFLVNLVWCNHLKSPSRKCSVSLGWKCSALQIAAPSICSILKGDCQVLARGRSAWLCSTGSWCGWLSSTDPHAVVSYHQAALCCHLQPGVTIAWPSSQRAWSLTPSLTQPRLRASSTQPGQTVYQTVCTVGLPHPSPEGVPWPAQWPATFAPLGQVDTSGHCLCVPHTATQDLGSPTQTPLLCPAMKFCLSHVYT